MLPPGRRGALGPVQVLLIGIDAPGSDQMLAAELQDLGTQDAIAVLDVLRVRRGADDEIRRLDPTGTGEDSGRLVEALMVIDRENLDGASGGRGADSGPEGAWFLAERIPRGASVAILLIEHRWAIPLREAAGEYEAVVFGDAWLHPQDVATAYESIRPPPS